MTLRYLASGDLMKSIAYDFCVGHSTATEIIYETSAALYSALKTTYLARPTTEQWKKTAKEFASQWNMPNCCGAVDGKHIWIKCPPKAGSEYYNYKKFHSIVLLAVVDANYKFLFIDVGAYGSLGDRAVYSSSALSKELDNNTLGLPGSEYLPNSNEQLPYFFVGDEAFPLQTNMMRPYPGRNKGKLPLKEQVFNYR